MIPVFRKIVNFVVQGGMLVTGKGEVLYQLKCVLFKIKIHYQ
jgi:hypothetical protein